MIKILIRALLFLFVVTCPATAQVMGGSPVYTNWYPTGNIPSAAITTSSSAHLFPSIGPTAHVCNRGNVDAFINPQGTSNAVTSTTNSFLLPAGACINYNLKPSTTQYTYWAAITASGSTTLYVETGQGAINGSQASAGGGGSATNPTFAKSAALTTGTTLGTLYAIVPCDTSGGGFRLTIPVSLGSLAHVVRIRIEKVSADANSISISADGSTDLAYVFTPSMGNDGGYLDVEVDGFSLHVFGNP